MKYNKNNEEFNLVTSYKGIVFRFVKIEISFLNPFLVRYTCLDNQKRPYYEHFYCLPMGDFYLVMPLPENEELRTVKANQIKEQIALTKKWLDITDDDQLRKKYALFERTLQNAMCSCCSKIKPVIYLKMVDDLIEVQLTKMIKIDEIKENQIKTFCVDCIKESRTDLEKEVNNPKYANYKPKIASFIEYFADIEKIFSHFYPTYEQR